ncbi:hypothetical protein JGH11_17000 [Dysgonomonas sp. Marseille-P4677]|uniref:hypothetical protein n=1 Tax=Dysgonomonas sp. Marseille-P4677 TaxID=2364790 RepID=UPI001912300E|nr:hypothetical protein [Dysgonomonas sp. Marseille-P4677]MBK5722574.1 hypothetical protein [Dysgonomonas sp. Marseille-P4677]
MSKEKDTYNQAKIAILNYIIVFCTNTIYEENGVYRNSLNLPSMHDDIPKGFVSCIGCLPKGGSLVRLVAAPLNTKWYLSWLKEYDKDRDRYLLESIDDGSLCWWTNISLDYLPTEISDKFPHWKYTDKQFSFWDRWKKAYRWEDAYWFVPLMPLFDGKKVTLELRKKFSDERFSKTFNDWKKLTIKEMREFVKDRELYMKDLP